MSDVITIRPVDAAYPERVRSAMKPPVLYAVGNLDLLELDGFGICGSRDASGVALEWAFDFGRQVAEGGGTLVSGYARGIDRQAHKGALEAGGSTIAVLPEGIDGFRVVKELCPPRGLGGELPRGVYVRPQSGLAGLASDGAQQTYRRVVAGAVGRRGA